MFVRRIWPSNVPAAASGLPDFIKLRQDMDRLFDVARDRSVGIPSAGVFPAINVTEDDENYYVRSEIPGISASDLQISAEQNKLSISGEREIPAEDGGASYHRRERTGGSFSRTFTLDWDFDQERVKANYSEGILTVTLPKVEPAKARSITVQTS